MFIFVVKLVFVCDGFGHKTIDFKGSVTVRQQIKCVLSSSDQLDDYRGFFP